MASILKVDKIRGTGLDSDTLSIDGSGNISTIKTFSAPGHVIQIVTNTYATVTATTSTTFVDTGLAATITPTSSSSKIFVLAACSMWQNTANGVSSITLYRGGSRVSDSAIYGYAYGYGGGSNHVMHHTPTFLDSPNTTSATEYKIYYSIKNLGGTLNICPNSTPSTLTLMEIAQ